MTHLSTSYMSHLRDEPQVWPYEERPDCLIATCRLMSGCKLDQYQVDAVVLRTQMLRTPSPSMNTALPGGKYPTPTISRDLPSGTRSCPFEASRPVSIPTHSFSLIVSTCFSYTTYTILVYVIADPVPSRHPNRSVH